MFEMFLTLFDLVWNNEPVSIHWRKGLIVSLFNIGDREDLGI